MNITKPTIQDIPQLLELWRGQYRYHHGLDNEYYVSNSEELSEKFKQYLIKSINQKEPNILVAKIDGELVGFITFEENSESYFDTKINNFGEVIELFVKEDNRSTGIGKKLMEEVEKYFSKKGLKYVKLQSSTYNKLALDFYKRIGYQNRQILLYKKIK